MAKTKNTQELPAASIDELPDDLRKLLAVIQVEMGIDYDTICSRTRTQYIVDARRIFSRIAVHKLGYTLSATGKYIGRSHSSVVHYLDSHSGFFLYDNNYAAKYTMIAEACAQEQKTLA